MTGEQILRTCRERGWIVTFRHWVTITPKWMTVPQGISARTLAKAFSLCEEWAPDE